MEQLPTQTRRLRDPESISGTVRVSVRRPIEQRDEPLKGLKSLCTPKNGWKLRAGLSRENVSSSKYSQWLGICSFGFAVVAVLWLGAIDFLNVKFERNFGLTHHSWTGMVWQLCVVFSLLTAFFAALRSMAAEVWSTRALICLLVGSPLVLVLSWALAKICV